MEASVGVGRRQREEKGDMSCPLAELSLMHRCGPEKLVAGGQAGKCESLYICAFRQKKETEKRRAWDRVSE